MLENPIVYVDSSDDTDDIPSNVTIIYRTDEVTVDEDGNVAIEGAESDERFEVEAEGNDDPEQEVEEKLLPPKILFETFSSTPKELYDGSIVSDVQFSVEDVAEASDYEVRYT